MSRKRIVTVVVILLALAVGVTLFVSRRAREVATRVPGVIGCRFVGGEYIAPHCYAKAEKCSTIAAAGRNDGGTRFCSRARMF